LRRPFIDMILLYWRQNPPIRIPDIEKNAHFGAFKDVFFIFGMKHFELFYYGVKSGTSSFYSRSSVPCITFK